jgi:hypothetical protein
MDELINLLNRVPAVKVFSGDQGGDGFWWVKFSINIEHKLSWNVIQELGHIVNYVSVTERLPTIFYPVSPPPYINGGPREYLSWVIENKDENFTTSDLKDWLEARLPEPIEDERKWGFTEVNV